MAHKLTRQQLIDLAISTNIKTQNAQEVTPETVRDQYTNERNSELNYVDDLAGGIVGQVLTVDEDGESQKSIGFVDLFNPAEGGLIGEVALSDGADGLDFNGEGGTRARLWVSGGDAQAYLEIIEKTNSNAFITFKFQATPDIGTEGYGDGLANSGEIYGSARSGLANGIMAFFNRVSDVKTLTAWVDLAKNWIFEGQIRFKQDAKTIIIPDNPTNLDALDKDNGALRYTGGMLQVWADNAWSDVGVVTPTPPIQEVLDVGAVSTTPFQGDVTGDLTGDVAGNVIGDTIQSDAISDKLGTGPPNLSQGLKLSGGASILSEYIESGTFTPIIEFSGASVGIIYATQLGVYSIIGKMCFIQMNIALTSKGTSIGNTAIPNLPVTIKNVNGFFPLLTVTSRLLTYTGELECYLTNNTTEATLTQVGSGISATSISNVDFANGTTLLLSGSCLIE